MNKELIARLRSMLKDTTDDAADAIESLQAEVERLRVIAKEASEYATKHQTEVLRLRAQLAPKKTLEVMAQEAALEQAQPEQCILEHNFASLDTAGNRHPEFRYAGYKGQPIKAGASQDQADAYAEGVRATKQAQPERAPDCRIELVNAIHTLASHYENKCYKFQDDEEVLKAAQGDIAHAMQIAAKWNWNGNSAQQSQSVEAAQPEPSKDFQELAKVYASMYASPHHIVFSTEGLKRFVAAAAQQAQPERAPLTQTQVVDAFCELKHNTQYVSVFDAGVRFAEKHHGIKGGAA